MQDLLLDKKHDEARQGEAFAPIGSRQQPSPAKNFT
jgi:hypothetical protein